MCVSTPEVPDSVVSVIVVSETNFAVVSGVAVHTSEDDWSSIVDDAPRADLDNVRKRCAAQVNRAEAEARAAVTRQWLAVVDNLDLALEHAEADPASIIDGVRAVRAQALDILARLGFARRDDRGARFDPARHEAVASRPDPEAEADVVAEVVRPAYGEGDHQLRPAQVVVARPG